jgi:hypothetical protein
VSSVAHREPSLFGTEGYVLESEQGDLGRIEEVVVGEDRVPVGLDVVTNDGWHGLLRAEDVLVVDRDYHWVVVPRDPALRTADGEVRRPRPREPRPIRLPWRGLRRRSTPEKEFPIWRAIAIELTFIALVVLAVVAVSFLVARVVTGAAY